jgi:hypothetical protein
MQGGPLFRGGFFQSNEGSVVITCGQNHPDEMSAVLVFEITGLFGNQNV